ncbi:MAG: cytochrome c [Proteobacteria bacterium]|nr:cytochrome c [Pseudomonadota bacterium]
MHNNKQPRRLVALCGALALVSGAGSAWADAAGNWKDGKEVYEKVCAYCHDKGIGPTIKGIGIKSEDIIRTVRSGNKAMPPFRQTEIDEAALAKLAEYLQ